MKGLILFTAVILVSKMAISQTVKSDTLFMGKNKKMVCKIVEISETEFKYRMVDMPDGPIYVVDRSKVSKYILSNGFSEVVKMDEMSLENEHKEILGNREVIKIQPFTIALNYISIGYERVLKVGTNLDVEAGYINNSMTSNYGFNSNGVSSYNGAPFYYGFYFKPGVKFFLGQDFSVKGLKYAHPLKGRYIKLDLAVSYLNFDNVTTAYYLNTNPYPWNGGQPTQSISTNISSIAYGGFINYGRQFILGNILTLDYYVGLGFTAQSTSYSNSSYLSTLNSPGSYYNWNDGRNVSRYGAFARMPGIGVSGTAGLRIGYIIPAKKLKQPSKTEAK